MLTPIASPMIHRSACSQDRPYIRAIRILRPLLWHAIACFVVASTSWSQDVAELPKLQPTAINEGRTAIDDYVAAPDDSYAWNLVAKQKVPGATIYVIDLKSQTWLTEAEVDRTLWQHYMTVVRPDAATADTAMMLIVGGSNGKAPPTEPDARSVQVAVATNSVVAAIGMIPNQPLVFHNDGQPRVEDDLVAYTWDQYLETGDARWPARLPMVKAVVRAMDTVQELLSKDESPLTIRDFVVAGGSKRGWTTWMTAAVDSRVAAIAPIVIDVLNVNLSMEHHYAAYGFWAPAIGDYVEHKITERRYQSRYRELLQIVDPFAYRDRFTMPKCIINATGDQFFVPDSSQFYFDELVGEKHLCYVPNGEHSLNGTDALESLAAFHFAIVNDIPRPKFTWEFNDDEIHVKTVTKPQRVLLWQATNPDARDFRVDSIGRAYKSTELLPQADGSFVAHVQQPAQGWTAYLVQLEFNIGAPTPIRLTTPVRITPELLPFADKVAPVAVDGASE